MFKPMSSVLEQKAKDAPISYAELAKESRLKCLELVWKAQTSHIGSLFSCADIMAVVFSKIDLDKDVFVLSKGWAACMLYFHLWKKGRITEEQLNSYCQEGSEFIGLAEPIIPEIKIAGGSMGLGLPGAVGIAFAKKLKGEDGKVYVLMSDGELNCGTTWESALIAAHHKLDNIVVIVDMNRFQAMGKTEDILNPSYPGITGWTTSNPDGHDFGNLERILDKSLNLDMPCWILAKTTKGKGVSFMENNNDFHYLHVTDEIYEKAKAELNEK